MRNWRASDSLARNELIRPSREGSGKKQASLPGVATLGNSGRLRPEAACVNRDNKDAGPACLGRAFFIWAITGLVVAAHSDAKEPQRYRVGVDLEDGRNEPTERADAGNGLSSLWS